MLPQGKAINKDIARIMWNKEYNYPKNMHDKHKKEIIYNAKYKK